jgi:hypothetical protein
VLSGGGASSVMAAGGSRARADYDYLIKLLLIGDSGMCRVDVGAK